MAGRKEVSLKQKADDDYVCSSRSACFILKCNKILVMCRETIAVHFENH